MFEDQARIHDVSRIGRDVALTTGSSIGVEDGGAHAEWLKVFAIHHAFSEAQLAKAGSGQSADRRKPSRWFFRAGPATGRQHHLAEDRDRRTPPRRVLHDGAVLED